jgi:hypothetical protein
MSSTGILESRPRVRALLGAGVVALVLLVASVLWLRGTPDDLPVGDALVPASTPVDQPVYVGVFSAGTDFGRTLHLSGVKIHATSNTDVSIEPLLCRGGAVAVTTEPEAFCPVLVNPEGQDLGAGDSIVIQVLSDEPAVAVVDPVRLSFSENLQWATLPAGSGAVVRILPR